MKNSRDFFYAQEDINYIGGVKEDMKDDVVRFLKNNINSSVYNKQKRFYETHPDATRVPFNGEQDLYLTQWCLLDLKGAKRNFAAFMEQKATEPQIISDILNNIKEMAETNKIVDAVDYIKRTNNINSTHEATAKLRKILYSSL